MTAATAAPPKNLGRLDHLLDDSLEDFEHCLSLPVSRSNSRFFSIPLPTTSAKGETPHPQHPHHHQQATPFGYPSVHSGFRSDDTVSDMSDQEVDGGEASHGGYSPPAWRRLANGDRSSGFWRKANSRLNAIDPLLLSGFGGLGGGLLNGVVGNLTGSSSGHLIDIDLGPENSNGLGLDLLATPDATHSASVNAIDVGPTS